MKKQIPLTPVLAIALVIVLAVGFLALVKPKMDESARLDAEIASTQDKIAEAARAKPKDPADAPVQIDVADLFLLAKAMPDGDDMPGIILELNGIASAAGVGFVSIQPLAPVTVGSYRVVPINLTFEGNYYDLTDFLFRMRSLVRVNDGVLNAKGRLYTLDALDMHEADGGFPKIEAVLTVSAYAYGAGAGAPAAPAAPPAAGATTGATTTGATTGGTTTGATATQTTPTTASDASRQASGANG